MLEWSGVLVNGVGAGYVLKGQTFIMIQADWQNKGSRSEDVFATLVIL